MCTLERRELEVFRADMALERLVFAEGFVAWRVGRTPEPIMPFMCQLVSS
jgi:hypothetical protein